MGQPGKSKDASKPGRGRWKDRQGWLRLTPLAGLAATHYGSEELVIIFMVFNSGPTRHRNQVFCKHLSVFLQFQWEILRSIMQNSHLLPSPLHKFLEAIPGGDTQRGLSPLKSLQCSTSWVAPSSLCCSRGCSGQSSMTFRAAGEGSPREPAKSRLSASSSPVECPSSHTGVARCSQVHPNSGTREPGSSPAPPEAHQTD